MGGWVVGPGPFYKPTLAFSWSQSEAVRASQSEPSVAILVPTPIIYRVFQKKGKNSNAVSFASFLLMQAFLMLTC